ncbi:MAG: 50S ribosomal protein L11 methyltransferase [Bacteroidales bacterium]|nr:50S ribosomal protein L11 methyltransferase [Bacteroidales bacterium]
MRYLEVQFSNFPLGFEADLLVAELAEIGFDSFQEEEGLVSAFIPAELYKKNSMHDLSLLSNYPEVEVLVIPLEDKNWNEEWEKHYEPVIIGEKCCVRAPFHPSLPGMQYEIVIEPKMSFGTAHHATTQLMAGWLMDLDINGKEVLDMGCGTGILAILANKMGARHVMAVDNDEWTWQNAFENLRNNRVTEGIAQLGDSSVIGLEKYDLILANINRNVLIQDMEKYVMGLQPEGQLLLSGFYESDTDMIKASAKAKGMKYEGTRTLNDWAVVLFSKLKA